jgi:hypothetical protein
MAGVFDSTEATTGFEPVIRVLQTLALPLGHVAMRYSFVPDDGIWGAKNALLLIRILQTLAVQLRSNWQPLGHVAILLLD